MRVALVYRLLVTALSWLALLPRYSSAKDVEILGASVGYLSLEALGHGVPRGRALAGRVTAVAALGFAHAVAVTALTLAAVAPAIKPGLARTLDGHHALAA